MIRTLSSRLLCAIILLVQLNVFPAAAADATTNATTSTNVIVSTNVATVFQLTDEQRAQLTFGLDKVPSLQRKILNIELWQYVASLIYIFLAFAVARLIDYLICVQLKKWVQKTTTTLDDIFIEIAHGPIKVIAFVIFLHIGLQIFRWPHWIEVWISRGLQVVVALSLTYMLVKLIDLLIVHWRKRAIAKEKHFNEQLFPVTSKALKTFVVVIAVLVTSQNM